MRRLNARSLAVFGPRSAAAIPTAGAAGPMDAPAFQFRPPPPSAFSLLSRIGKHPRGSSGGFCASLLASAAAAVFLILFLRLQFLAGDRLFGVIIDGGSTGTRIHVFAYVVGRGGVPVLDLGATTTMRVNPGLSAYADEPEMAGESLTELLDFARGRVPRSRWGETEIHLMATAGLRLLEGRVQERILESCRNVLNASGFRFQPDWASVITGKSLYASAVPSTDEGIYAWVTANYALGTLGGDPQHTTGIIELGGASAQVTFVSSEPFPPEFARVLQFGKTTYNLYSHSFLHFGQNVAHDSLNKLLSSGALSSDGNFVDPCTPRGYSGGMDFMKPLGGHTSNEVQITYTSGNFSQCRSAALTLLQSGKGSINAHNIAISAWMSFLGYAKGWKSFMYVLELILFIKGSMIRASLIVCFANFVHLRLLYQFFGLGSTAVLSDFVMAGERFCGEHWTKLERKYHYLKEDDVLHYCFSSAYIVALLHDSLGVALDDKRVVFANQVSNIPLDWALGAFIMHRMADSNGEHTDWITGILHGDSSAMPYLFVFSIFLVVVVWSVYRWRKTQLKTIYDLEKGRYIVTRVTL
ncbi:hypothetical protein Taro_038141 [Colocasia esculenta]|uniref:Apyrase 6 n=1 Tax=Colocasia esculenta TaxID=4460 RepID=A0A843W7E4_COLES|nr:hypothetical protein [Colocasia esculenta]